MLATSTTQQDVFVFQPNATAADSLRFNWKLTSGRTRPLVVQPCGRSPLAHPRTASALKTPPRGNDKRTRVQSSGGAYVSVALLAAWAEWINAPFRIGWVLMDVLISSQRSLGYNAWGPKAATISAAITAPEAGAASTFCGRKPLWQSASTATT